jgi:hypothetical protein
MALIINPLNQEDNLLPEGALYLEFDKKSSDRSRTIIKNIIK